MNKNDANNLEKLRQYLIGEYKKLSDPNSPSTMMKEADAGRAFITAIRSVEDLMKPHVQFEKRG